MLSVQFMINKDPKNKINKTLNEGEEFEFVLKDRTSILRPTLIIGNTTDLYQYNYMYIPEFNRYYFIDDIVSLKNNLWEVSAHVDVLETYKNQILANNAILNRNQFKFNTYLNDPDWMVYAYDDIITFRFTQSEFTKGLDYLLVVAGGA